MGKKLTFKEVSEYIESQGYTLLDDIYINDHTHLNIKCPLEHIYAIIWNSFKNGRRCPVCKGLEATKRQRMPYETIHKKVNDIGRKLLTTKEEYELNYSKENKHFTIECVCGEPHITTLDRVKKKCLCKKCANNKKTKTKKPLNRRKTIEEVKKLFNENGYDLLSIEYKNCFSLLLSKCPNDHDFYISYSSFRAGHRCSTCYGNKTKSSQDIQNFVEKEGYVLLKIKKNKNKYILYTKCSNNHEYRVTYGDFQQGYRCSVCYGNKKKTFEEVKEYFKKYKYGLTSTEYKNSNGILDSICSKGHLHRITYNNFQQGSRCSICIENGTSDAEKELYTFIKEFYPDAINNDRTLISPLELDIYIPSLSLAIEYCGLYWHSEEYKDNGYHHTKMKLCNGKGVRLITVFEDEWLERKEQVKNFLLSVIKKNKTSIMGRKTQLREVPKEEAIDFLDEAHIQGSSLFEIAFGLYYNNELVGIITGNKHHRQGHGNLFVLNRLAFKSNTSVSGGSSKLLKALIQYAKEKGYEKLISWSDNRWSEGNVYEKTGFSLTEELPPDYSYVRKQTRISKQSCQKKNLIKKGAVGRTEREMALYLKLYRIYDCGKKRWEINLNP